MIIHHSRPFVGKAECQALARVIASKHLAGGRELDALERELAALVGHARGVGVSSGTAALYLALNVLGIGKGHGVIMPSYACTALLNATLLLGAEPHLADVNPAGGLLDADGVKKARRANSRAVIVPHLFGIPIDIRSIASLGLPVIEDCAQCLGTQIGGRAAGGQAAITVYSFYATKLLAAGEGGMITTADKATGRRIINLRTYDKCASYHPTFNFKLSDLHAAVARRQLAKLPAMVRRRRALASIYRQELSGSTGIELLPVNTGSVYYRFVIKVRKPAWTIEKMRARGVECGRPVYKPLHRYLGLRGFPGADEFFGKALSLPIYPDLTENQARHCSTCLKKILEHRDAE